MCAVYTTRARYHKQYDSTPRNALRLDTIYAHYEYTHIHNTYICYYYYYYNIILCTSRLLCVVVFIAVGFFFIFFI